VKRKAAVFRRQLFSAKNLFRRNYRFSQGIRTLTIYNFKKKLIIVNIGQITGMGLGSS
jgi:hypothetical protein